MILNHTVANHSTPVVAKLPSESWIVVLPPFRLQPILTNASSTLENGSASMGASSTTETNYNVELNGFQAFCAVDAADKCSSSPVNDCDACNPALIYFFLSLVALFGAAIVFGNLIIAWSVFRKKSISKFDIVKVSLAFADLLTGVTMFAVVIPNISWTLGANPEEILQRMILSVGSREAQSAGIFFVLGMSSSLFHLLLLSAQRLYAVRFPMRYKLQSKLTIVMGVAVAWALGVFAAAVPAMFPDVFLYTYNHVLYLYYPTLTFLNTPLQTDQNTSYVPVIVLMVFSYALPYVMMMSMVFATLVYIRVFVMRSRELMSLDSHHKSKLQALRREASVFTTVSIMIVGFTITLLPLLIVTILYYSGSINKSNYSIPYLVAFYLSMSSGLVNVLVYSVRDDAYKSALRRLFCCEDEDIYRSRSTTRRTTNFSSLSSINISPRSNKRLPVGHT